MVTEFGAGLGGVGILSAVVVSSDLALTQLSIGIRSPLVPQASVNDPFCSASLCYIVYHQRGHSVDVENQGCPAPMDPRDVIHGNIDNIVCGEPSNDAVVGNN